MLKSRTLFVVGAGASHEVGLPLGSTLKLDLAKRLKIEFSDGFSQSAGDRDITEALHRITAGSEGRRGNINPLLEKAWQMSRALPQAISIDNYIDAREDEQIALLGKLAIASDILESERASRLFIGERSTRDVMLAEATNTNYQALFQLLSEGLRNSTADRIFENVGIISFNYDRSLEWYFQNAIANYFAVADQVASQIVDGLSIVHPYGTLGPLPTSGGRSAGTVSYGGASRWKRLEEPASSIRTFTEQIADPATSDAIEKLVTSAEHLVFLGFGYHDINMQTLATKKNTALRRVFGTALGVSKSDTEAIAQTIRMAFQGVGRDRFGVRPNIELRADLKCVAMFEEYGRSLRA